MRVTTRFDARDPFTSLMGVTYIADPTPGRHTAGSASWNETFGAGFSLKQIVPDRFALD